VQACQLPIEHGVAGSFGEDPVETGAQHSGAPGIGFTLICLQVGIEPPDQATLEFERATMRIA